MCVAACGARRDEMASRTVHSVAWDMRSMFHDAIVSCINKNQRRLGRVVISGSVSFSCSFVLTFSSTHHSS